MTDGCDATGPAVSLGDADGAGNVVPEYTFANGNGVVFRPAAPLEPNALYTFTGYYINSLGELSMYAADFSTSGQADSLGPKVMTSTFEAIPEEELSHRRRRGRRLAGGEASTADQVQDDIDHKIIFDESIVAGSAISDITAYRINDDGTETSWTITASVAEDPASRRRTADPRRRARRMAAAPAAAAKIWSTSVVNIHIEFHK